ncbi:MAG: HDOD domain-containing protein [Desulfohalobiaceae bacterium]
MGKVSIDQLVPGMQLAQDVLAPNGRKLLPQGRQIERRHIQTFKAWGVTEVEVVKDNVAQAAFRPKVSQHHLDRARDLLKPFFLLTNTQKEPLKTIFKLAWQQTALQLAHGQKAKNIREIPSVAQLKDLASYEPEQLQDPDTLIAEEIQLLTLPDIYHRIMEVLNSPRSSAVHVAEVVSKDSSLSAKLLKLVNSPFYGFNTKVDTISRAIALLGVNKLVTLAQGIAVVRVFRDIPSQIVDMHAFWKHSVGCGVLAKLLAAQKAGLEEERFFVAGLLHDIGRMIMFKSMPLMMSRCILLSLQNRVILQQAEKQLLKFDHAALGQKLCAKWLLPQNLSDMISCHHAPMQTSTLTIEAGIVHTADILCHALGLGLSGNVFVPDIDLKTWNKLQISNSALQPVISQSDRQIKEIVNIFLDKE